MSHTASRPVPSPGHPDDRASLERALGIAVGRWQIDQYEGTYVWAGVDGIPHADMALVGGHLATVPVTERGAVWATLTHGWPEALQWAALQGMAPAVRATMGSALRTCLDPAAGMRTTLRMHWLLEAPGGSGNARLDAECLATLCAADDRVLDASWVATTGRRLAQDPEAIGVLLASPVAALRQRALLWVGMNPGRLPG